MMLNRTPEIAVKAHHDHLSKYEWFLVAFIALFATGVLWLIVAALLDGRLD